MALTKAHNRMIEGASINVKDYGAIGDGVTDDTAAIQAAKVAGSQLYFPPGTYVVDPAAPDDSVGIFHFSSTDGIHLSGYDATIQSRAGTGIYGARTFRFTNCDNVLVEGLTIDCNKANQTGGYDAIGIFGGDHITIRDCVILNGKQDGIYVRGSSPAVESTYPKNVLIDHVYIDAANRNGISVIGVDGIKITNSTIVNTSGEAPGAGIDFEPNSSDPYGINNAIVSDCIFENNDSWGIVVTGSDPANPGETPYTKNITINNIICRDNGIATFGSDAGDVGIYRAGSCMLNGYLCDSNVEFTKAALIIVDNEVQNASLSNLMFRDIQHTDNSKELIYIDTPAVTANTRTVNNVHAYNCNINIMNVGTKVNVESVYAEDCDGVHGITCNGDEATIKDVTLLRCEALTATSTSTLESITIIDSVATYPLRIRGNNSTYKDIIIKNTGTATSGAVWLDDASGTDDVDSCVFDGFHIWDDGGYWDTLSNVYLIEQTSLTGNHIRNMIPSPLSGSATWDPANIASGSSASTTVSLLRGDVGDRCITTHSVSLQGLMSFASVTSSNTATVTLFNPTGGAIDLASHTVTIEAIK